MTCIAANLNAISFWWWQFSVRYSPRLPHLLGSRSPSPYTLRCRRDVKLHETKLDKGIIFSPSLDFSHKCYFWMMRIIHSWHKKCTLESDFTDHFLAGHACHGDNWRWRQLKIDMWYIAFSWLQRQSACQIWSLLLHWFLRYGRQWKDRWRHTHWQSLVCLKLFIYPKLLVSANWGH